MTTCGPNWLVLVEWERARVSRVTRAEVAVRCGDDKADKITSALVRKGALRRVGRVAVSAFLAPRCRTS